MMETTNPCHNCQAHWLGEKRKAPCCWGSTVVVNTEEYRRHFLQPYLEGEVDVEESLRDGEMFFWVSFVLACPKLDVETGECTVHGSNQPKACQDMTVGQHPYCVQSNRNRYPR